MSEFSGKTAIVTGAGQGIGRAIAKRFLEAGMGVVIAEVDEDAGNDAAAALEAFGEVYFKPCDVADEAAVARLVTDTVNRFGGVDVLINNAGRANPYHGPVEQLSLTEWRRWIDTNLTGVFLACKHAVPHLRKARGGIVNIASTRALQSEPHTEAYAASKGGVVALTHALAVSLGPEIRVNCISPGWIDVSAWKKPADRHPAELSPQDHAQHPAGRVGRPEDVAELALYLVSAGAAFITGQNLVIDGGMTRRMIYVEP